MRVMDVTDFKGGIRCASGDWVAGERMSSAFRKSLVQAALKTPGGVKTIDDRRDVAERIADFCATHNIQCRDIGHLKEKHLRAYVEARQSTAGKRTLQTEMSHVRQILRQAGRHQLADSPRLSNRALGLDGVSRTGTRLACPRALYEKALHLAQARDKAVAACLALQHTFGLRAEEAVQAGKSLNDWQKALERGFSKLPVIYGTKGGKLREVHVVDTEKAKAVVARAIEARHGPNLINKPTIQQAMAYYHRETSKAGLTGVYSPHALRYAYARDCYNDCLKRGMSAENALAFTSLSLGHGDGRGRWLKSVYLQGMDNADWDG
jgi:site-specific recombinase XerD